MQFTNGYRLIILVRPFPSVSSVAGGAYDYLEARRACASFTVVLSVRITPFGSSAPKMAVPATMTLLPVVRADEHAGFKTGSGAAQERAEKKVGEQRLRCPAVQGQVPRNAG